VWALQFTAKLQNKKEGRQIISECDKLKKKYDKTVTIQNYIPADVRED
jgi:hypothetical protein